MRSSSLVRTFVLFGVCVAVALAAPGISAQSPAPAKPAAGAAVQPPPQPGGPGGLGLTEEQRESIQTLQKQHRAEMAPLQEQMKAAREKLRAASRAEVFDEAAVRAAANALATTQAEVAVAQARHRAQFTGLLTPDQRQRQQQIEQRQKLRRERLERRFQMIRERVMAPGAGEGLGRGPGRGRRMMMERFWRR